MLLPFLLFSVLICTYAIVLAKRIHALIRFFRFQSIFLFLATLIFAVEHKNPEVFVIAGLLLVMKVILIPYFLQQFVKKMNVEERLGLFINPVLSLVIALIFTYISSVFTLNVFSVKERFIAISFAVSFTVIFVGFFIMVFRMKAVSQIIGLLVMENGIFLLATAIAGGMPFFVEIATFFDVFVCVIIIGIFMYRVNKVFTHIEVHKLTDLRG